MSRLEKEVRAMVSWVTDPNTGKSIPLFKLEDLRDHVSDEVYQAITELIDPDVIKELEDAVDGLEKELDSYSEDIRIYRDCLSEGSEQVEKILDILNDRGKKLDRGKLISEFRKLYDHLIEPL